MFSPSKRVFDFVNIQRSYIWDCIPPDIIDNSKQLLPGVLIGDFCYSLRIPSFKFSDVTSIKYGSEKRSYPGNLTISNMEAVFICPVPNIVSHYFHSWFDLITHNGVYYPKVNYAKDCNVILYDRSGIPTEWIVFKGVFPLNMSEHELDNEGTRFLEYKVSLNVDRHEYKSAASVPKKII